jgi:UDP-N-acetylglucosamine transferase subunit ALG13
VTSPVPDGRVRASAAEPVDRVPLAADVVSPAPAARTSEEDKPLLLVSVGTDHHPFDRVIEWVFAWLRDGGADKVRAVVQYGTSTAPAVELPGVLAKPYLDHQELQDGMRDAWVVISHGGPATILETRRKGHLPVVVPRDSRFGEHVDGHQVAFCTEMGRRGDIVFVESEAHLRRTLEHAFEHPEQFELDTDATDPETAHTVNRIASLVDQLVAVNPAGGRRTHRTAPTDKSSASGPTVLYLGGLGRSGSTLLDRMLGQYPGFCSVGEAVHLWERGLLGNEKCGCGMTFETCEFWREVGRKAFGGWDAVDPQSVIDLKYSVDRQRYLPLLMAPRPPADFARRITEYGDMLRALYTAVQEVSGAEVIVDSSKHTSYAYLLRRVPGLSLRTVHVVRDSRGVAYSWSKTVRRPETTESEEFMPVYSPLRSSVQWDLDNTGFALLERLGVPRTVMRYEDLLANPPGEVARVAAFAKGVPSVQAPEFVTATSAELGVNHTVAGNPMRFVTGRLELRPDQAWRSKLSARDRRIVSALTAPARLCYGYYGKSES